MKKGRDPIDDLFETLLRHMYQAEVDVLDQLKNSSEQAFSEGLKELFDKHISQTEEQIKRLQKSFAILETEIEEPDGILEKGKKLAEKMKSAAFPQNKALDGLIKEGNELMKRFSRTELHDLVLSDSAQNIEIGEIAAYKILCRLAANRGYDRVLKLLVKTLDEESDMHQLLSSFSENELKRLKEEEVVL